MTDQRAVDEARRTLMHVRSMRDEFVDFIGELCRVESPTDRPDTQAGVHAILAPFLEDLGYDIRMISGRTSGDHLLAVPRARGRGPVQLLIGHSDTVWPVDTLERMPVEVVDGRLHGPGTLDMKGGLTQILFALRALRDLGHDPEVAPVVFVNADEEAGSPDSVRHVQRLARASCRALVMEPSLGSEGRIKTARKGVGLFDITIRGRASHAGLDPEAGSSAILELAYVIGEIDAINDPESGTTVNVGLVRGGTRSNVIAAEAEASVDVRVTSAEAGAVVIEKIRSIRPQTPGVTIAVDGGMRAEPLERTPRNRRLWESARVVGRELGFDLQEAMVGGGSDGNTTSLFTATLDGLGCIGDGAHADHEHILIDPSLDRCALLARLLLTPP
jgi:glutamate carboxypeptidase